MYERHLQSDLHLRRTLPERQLDMDMGVDRSTSDQQHHPQPRKRLKVVFKVFKDLAARLHHCG